MFCCLFMTEFCDLEKMVSFMRYTRVSIIFKSTAQCKRVCFQVTHRNIFIFIFMLSGHKIVSSLNAVPLITNILKMKLSK